VPVVVVLRVLARRAAVAGGLNAQPKLREGLAGGAIRLFEEELVRDGRREGCGVERERDSG
jgi:hypothetical protein